MASLVDMSKKLYACCAKCNKITHSSSQTRYIDPVSHARPCFDELEEKYHEHMQNLYYDCENKAVKVQQGLLKAMLMKIAMFISHTIFKISDMITQLR